MNLHRTSPPDGDPLEISKGVWVHTGPPRTIEGATPEQARQALQAACERIWGQDWQRCMGEVFDLNRTAFRDWCRRDQVPPPAILGWVGLISASPNYRSIGGHLVGYAMGDGDKIAAAIFARL